MANSWSRRIMTSALVLFALLAASAAPIHQQAVALAADRVVFLPDSEECKFFNQINAFRKRNHLPALQFSLALGAAADFHSTQMATRNYFSHNLKGLGISWSQNIRRFGYKGNTLGENIAAGFDTGNRAFKAWLHSKPHKANMMNPRFRAIGIGRAYDAHSRYGWYWTTDFGDTVDATISCR